MANEEIEAKLVLNDEASASIQRVAEVMLKAAAAAKHMQHETSKMGERGKAEGKELGVGLKEGVFMGIGEKIFEKLEAGFEKLKETAKEVWEAGVGEEAGRRQLAGVLAMTSRSGSSFESLMFKAEGFKDQLEEIGIEAGVAESQLTDMFGEIAARSNKSSAQVAELTKKMAYAGRAVPGGTSALASGFQMMELGMIRARNPIVQLISSTGMLAGNAKSVAAQLQKMTPEAQMEMATAAVEKMSDQMKKAPPTWEQVMTSMRGMHEKLTEEVGHPLVMTVVPALDEIRQSMMDHMPELQDAFGAAGMALADEVHKILPDGVTLVDYLKTAAGLIKESVEFFDFYLNAWNNTIAFLAEQVAEMDNFMDVGGATGGHKRYAGFMAEKTIAGAEKDLAAHPRDADTKKLDKDEQQFYAYAKEAGIGIEKAERMWRDALADHNHMFNVTEDAMREVVQTNARDFAHTFEEARKAHNEATEKYVAQAIIGSEAMKHALMDAGPDIFGQGVNDFLKYLKMQGPEGKAIEEELRKSYAAKEDKKPPNFNFHGGIHIVQNFRDQDPDRVAFILQRDLTKAAINRVQSQMAPALVGGPFG